MNSKARIAGRPLHPMLVAFPIALFAGTIGLELAHVATQDPFYYRAAMIANIAGVLAGLLAAIPGAIDLFALPKGSRARLTGDRHALFNILTVVVFAISAVLLYSGWNNRMLVDGGYNLDAHIPLALGMVGIVSMGIAALLDYALAHSHNVGLRGPVAVSAARRPARERMPALRPARLAVH